MGPQGRDLQLQLGKGGWGGCLASTWVHWLPEQIRGVKRKVWGSGIPEGGAVGTNALGAKLGGGGADIISASCSHSMPWS